MSTTKETSTAKVHNNFDTQHLRAVVKADGFKILYRDVCIHYKETLVKINSSLTDKVSSMKDNQYFAQMFLDYIPKGLAPMYMMKAIYQIESELALKNIVKIQEKLFHKSEILAQELKAGDMVLRINNQIGTVSKISSYNVSIYIEFDELPSLFYNKKEMVIVLKTKD